MLSSFDAYRRGIGEEGAVEAFAILRDLGDLHGNIYLKRVTVARPGQGLGRRFSGSKSSGRLARAASISTASPTMRAVRPSPSRRARRHAGGRRSERPELLRGSAEPLGDPQVDQRLPRDAEAAAFAVQRLDDPAGEIDVDATRLATGGRIVDQSTNSEMSSPASNLASNSLALIFFITFNLVIARATLHGAAAPPSPRPAKRRGAALTTRPRHGLRSRYRRSPRHIRIRLDASPFNENDDESALLPERRDERLTALVPPAPRRGGARG